MFHTVTRVSVKDINTPTLGLKQAIPTLTLLQELLFLFQEESYIAVPTEPLLAPAQITISPGDLKDCRQYGTMHCCPKRIFPTGKRACTSELIQTHHSPPRDCLRKFEALDLNQPYVVAKPQNKFNLLPRSCDVAMPKQAIAVCPST